MNKYLWSILLSLIFFVIGLLTLSSYGINWDSPFHFMRGQTYLHFFLTGQKKFGEYPKISPVLIKPSEFLSRYNFNDWEGPDYVRLPQLPFPKKDYQKSVDDQRISFYQSDYWNGEYFFSKDGGHPPLNDLLMALSNRMVWGTLGLLGDIESYHLISLFFAMLGVFIVGNFAFKITGSILASIIASLSLGLFPLFFAESHFNIKDPIQASLFAGSVWSLWSWIKTNQLKWFIFLGVFTGMAIGVKWNIMFLPLIVLPWLWVIRKSQPFKTWFSLRKVTLYPLILLAAVFIFVVLIWPSTWTNPIGKLFEVAKFYQQVAIGPERAQPSGYVLPGNFNGFPSLLLIFQTPEIIWLFVIAALWRGLKAKDQLKTTSLLLSWVLVPLTRMTLPQASYFGGIREIMEVLPALAILAGIGGSWLISLLESRIKQHLKSQNSTLVFKTAMLGLVAIILAVPIIRYHPYQNLYYNNLIGGLKGAKEHNMIDWTIAYGSGYKQAVYWINQNAPPNSNLALITGNGFSISPLWLRDDISLSPDHFSGLDQKGEYLITRLNTISPNWFAYWYPIRFLKPIYELKVDGVAIETLYKNSPDLVKPGFNKELTTSDFKITPQFIDLGREVAVTRIKVQASHQCTLDMARSSDEFIGFFKEGDTQSFDHPTNLYVLSERKEVADNITELNFPAETARYIKIYIQDRDSCFFYGKILSISYLGE